MSLAGTRLGSYEVLVLLGAAGMGEERQSSVTSHRPSVEDRLRLTTVGLPTVLP